MWDDDPNPFVRFRRLTQAWHTAIGIGMSDDGFIALVRRLAPPFRATPLRWEPSPGVWVKDDYDRQWKAYASRGHTTYATGPLELRDRDGNVIPTNPEAYPIDSTRR